MVKTGVFCLSAAISLLGLVAGQVPGKDRADTTMFSGVIVDQADRIPIPDAHVWVHEQSGKAAFAAEPNRTGRFSIQLPEGYYDVMVGAPGFAPFCKKIWMKPDHPVTLEVILKPDEDTAQRGTVRRHGP